MAYCNMKEPPKLRNSVLREIFGIARHVKKSGQEVKDELRRELWGKGY